jgi:hypothetical protein
MECQAFGDCVRLATMEATIYEEGSQTLNGLVIHINRLDEKE